MVFLPPDSVSLFPDADTADEDGLLAIGGNLSVEQLLLAYRSGIFPWFNEDELPMWWSPDPRFVLFPEKLKVSKSMKKLLRDGAFELRVDNDFPAVIGQCSAIGRKGQDGTWITTNVISAYCRLHELGYAHSAEAWKDGKLAGGLYGIRMGNCFFGESMFSRMPNASKYAFLSYVKQLAEEGVKLIDCQVYTEHLESLGAEMIPRSRFLELIAGYM